MGNYSCSDFDNLNDLKTVLDETASDTAQVLIHINNWPEAELNFLKTWEVKAVEFDLNQKKDLESS
jgi:hypothetical protein